MRYEYTPSFAHNLLGELQLVTHKKQSGPLTVANDSKTRCILNETARFKLSVTCFQNRHISTLGVSLLSSSFPFIEYGSHGLPLARLFHLSLKTLLTAVSIILCYSTVYTLPSNHLPHLFWMPSLPRSQEVENDRKRLTTIRLSRKNA